MREKEEKKGVRKSASFFSFFFRGDDDGRRRNDGRRRMLKGLSLFPLDPAISSLEPPLLFVSPRGSREHVAFYLERGDRKHKRRMKAQNAPFWPEANLTLLLLLLLLLLFFLLAPKKKKKKKKKKKNSKTKTTLTGNSGSATAGSGWTASRTGGEPPPASASGRRRRWWWAWRFSCRAGLFCFSFFRHSLPPLFFPLCFQEGKGVPRWEEEEEERGLSEEESAASALGVEGKEGRVSLAKKRERGGGRESDGGALVFRERGF